MAGRHKLGKAGKGKEEVGSLAQSGLGGHPCAGTIRGQLERLSDQTCYAEGKLNGPRHSVCLTGESH